MTPPDFRRHLEFALRETDFTAASAELAGNWSNSGVGLESVEPVLRFMEEHPNVDYGVPGPLTHFIERFYGAGYEEQLVDSIRRRPTAHTVWLLSRVINGVKDDDARRQLIDVIGSVTRSAVADEPARQMATHLLQRLQE